MSALEKADEITRVEPAHPLTLEKTFAHFEQLIVLLTWFTTEGKKRIENPVPLSYEKWYEMFLYSFKIFYEHGERSTFLYQFQAVVERGIKDFAVFVAKNPEDEKTIRSWRHAIMYQLQYGARLGITKTSSKKRIGFILRLLDDMTQIALDLKDERFLEEIGSALYLEQRDIEAFVACKKNW